MRRVYPIALVLSLCALTPVAAQTPNPPPRLPSITLPAELDRVLRDYERAWKAGDEAALTALFTEDGFVPQPSGWVRGSAAIRAAYTNGSGDLRLRAHAFAVQDTVGYIIGAFGYGEGAAQRDGGKFVLALRRSPGARWLIAADLDAGNRQ